MSCSSSTSDPGVLSAGRPRCPPFVDASFEFPLLRAGSFEVPLLVDTGADRTILAPLDAMRLAGEVGVDIATLPQGVRSTGVGGQTDTRTVEAIVTLDLFSTPLTLTILDPLSHTQHIPSLLGRDVLSRFALIVEQRTNRVLLLEPGEADALRLP